MRASGTIQLGARSSAVIALCAATLCATASSSARAQAPAAEATPAPAAKPAAAGVPPQDSELAAESTDQGKATSESDLGTGLTLQQRIRAVSRHVFLKGGRFELEPFGGISTNEAFYRRWMAGARASYHFNDAFAIDIGGAGVLLDEYLDPAPILGQPPSQLADAAKMYGYADAGVTFAPLYGKTAVMAEWVVHFDAFVSGGVGATFDATAPIVHPAMQLGIGGRIFLTRWLVLRGDLRDYVYPQDRGQGIKVQNALLLNLGLGFFFPFDFEYDYEAAKVQS